MDSYNDMIEMKLNPPRIMNIQSIITSVKILSQLRLIEIQMKIYVYIHKYYIYTRQYLNAKWAEIYCIIILYFIYRICGGCLIHICICIYPRRVIIANSSRIFLLTSPIVTMSNLVIITVSIKLNSYSEYH